MLVLSGFAWGLLSAEPALRACRSLPSGSSSTGSSGRSSASTSASSTEPAFHSSIYGLLALSNQWLAGISFAILLGLWTSDGKAPRAASGVLITAILIWAYMHAMQYIVIWAGDIPDEVHWYLERGATDGWRWPGCFTACRG